MSPQDQIERNSSSLDLAHLVNSAVELKMKIKASENKLEMARFTGQHLTDGELAVLRLKKELEIKKKKLVRAIFENC